MSDEKNLLGVIGMCRGAGKAVIGTDMVCDFLRRSAEKKKSSEKGGKLSAAYWLIATAVYLATSFIANAWGKTWIIWPIAGVLFPVVYIIGNSVFNKKNK